MRKTSTIPAEVIGGEVSRIIPASFEAGMILARDWEYQFREAGGRPRLIRLPKGAKVWAYRYGTPHYSTLLAVEYGQE